MSDPTITIRKGRFRKPCHTTYTNYNAQLDTHSKIDMPHLMQVLENKFRNKRILRDFSLPQKSEYGSTYSVWTDRVAEREKASQRYGTAEYEFDRIDGVRVLQTPEQVKLLGFKSAKAYPRSSETYITTPDGCEKCEAKPFTVDRNSLQWYDSNTTVQPPGHLNTATVFNVILNVHYKFKQQVNSKQDPTPADNPTSLVLWSPTLTKSEIENADGYIASTLYLMYQDMDVKSATCECYPS